MKHLNTRELVLCGLFIALITAGILWFMTTKTKVGRNLYALGGNREAAWYSGINVHRHQMIVYMISGTCAGLAGIVLTGRLSADAAKGIPKIRRGKSYALSLKGWSNFRLIAFDVHSGAMAYNRLGQPLTDVLRNTLCKKGNGQ